MNKKKIQIDYTNFNPDKEYNIKNEKASKSNARIIADTQTAERNKDPKIREKISKGNKKFYKEKFGTIEERFLNNIIKKDNGCWEFNQTWIGDNQPKHFSAKYFNLGFTKEIITQKCGNSKCINPQHLIEMDRVEQAEKMRNSKKLTRENGYGKLSIDDVRDVKKMYLEILKKNGGKHRGIASEIHLKYSNVTLTLISSICNTVKPNHLIDNTPILMYEFDDNTNTKGKFIKKYPNINSAVFDENREKKELNKGNIRSVLEGKTNRTGHGKTRRGGYVFEYEN